MTKKPAARASKSRKPSIDGISNGNNSKKRRSIAAPTKARENLTEEQKRANHIMSEQKRRNQIKEGFDDLNELVPAIRNCGLNKAGVLNGAADYLQELIRKNEEYALLISKARGGP